MSKKKANKTKKVVKPSQSVAEDMYDQLDPESMDEWRQIVEKDGTDAHKKPVTFQYEDRSSLFLMAERDGRGGWIYKAAAHLPGKITPERGITLEPVYPDDQEL